MSRVHMLRPTRRQILEKLWRQRRRCRSAWRIGGTHNPASRIAHSFSCTAPDIEMEQTPADVIAGRDPQLEKASKSCSPS